MTLHQKSNIEASVGTLIFMIFVLLLLMFIYIGAPKVEEEEGIEVAFGNADEGGGYLPTPAAEASSQSVAPAAQPAAPSNNDLMTQEDEESLALQRQREKDAKKQAEAEQERLRKQKEAEAQAEAERIAKEQALAQQKAQQQAAIDKANAMGSLFGNNNAGAAGSGDTSGDGHKGNPVGHGSQGGTEWSLNGRGIKALPQPDKSFEQAGKVVVNIQVDGDGNVISASIGTGTTVSDYKTQQLALNAARKAKFSKSENKIQMGTITYTFKFN